MCGIVGILQTGLKPEQWEYYLGSMSDSLVHRGPDDAGLWYDAEAGIGLGHRRLSIVDLSPLGRQPMISKSGRYYISYNGEVYNFDRLREELQSFGHTFIGHSDTEVLLAAIEQWGLEESTKRFIGMFAFALWDRHERVLHLVRDRLGIKPLYYGWLGKAFIFGSELKALRAHPEFNGNINRDALALMMRHNYIPAPYSIYRGIYKLLPGHILTLNSSTGSTPRPTPYWTAREIAEHGAANPFTGSETEAASVLDDLLRDAVGLRMVADVPLGAFLSGGIDSSLVVALMQVQSNRPVKTFSIGFHEQGYNEAEHAKAVANYLGTDHTELYVTPEQAMAVIPKLPTLYDEPFSDSSQIPTFLVSELARRYVTVSLSGDGGDELFGGYTRYKAVQELWRKIGWVPPMGRRILAKVLSATPTKLLDSIFGWLGPVLGKYGRPGATGDKLHKLAEILTVDCPEAMYREMISHWKKPAVLVPGAIEPLTVLTDSTQWAALLDFIHQMMYLDTLTYLPDDILTKVDRASMGVSLEARVPLLDHRVVEFAWQVPLNMKLRDGQGKWLLRQILYKYVPQSLIERPKMGFGVPIDSWLRGPLREWADSLLDERRLREEGFFNPRPIREKWTEHLSGQRNWQSYLWDVLVFQAWLEKNS
ncbi:asparagine synthase (glutamine-hydrolyzing) [Desulfolucanica intricata]|uniref:asparagine synthase (glutamine-hydrolyzing) n=1 Tax=Desulfolucanica intricata TaxID=1285191 RepID=UPI00082DFB33|nr:asparagine synthase (glutamine-hydrolyzing) [Desulfolucanica intricata]